MELYEFLCPDKIFSSNKEKFESIKEVMEINLFYFKKEPTNIIKNLNEITN